MYGKLCIYVSQRYAVLAIITDNIEKAVLVHPLSLYSYLQEEIHAKVDHFVRPKNPLRDIGELHGHQLAISLSIYKKDSELGTMTLFFTPTVSPEGVTYGSVVQNIHITKLIEDGFCMLILYGRHVSRSVGVLGT